MNRHRRDSTGSRATSMTLAWAAQTWSRCKASVSTADERYPTAGLTPVRERRKPSRDAAAEGLLDRQPSFVVEDLH
jgi:hypothetical protein